jgi:DnaJ-class molecular chaperone
MADMKLKAQQQEEAERKREAERAAREGSSYKTKEERTRQARQAKEEYAAGEETRSLESRFDPQKNYYSLLDVDRAASSAEIKKAYKKLALLYHPDKHKAAAEEGQRDAIAAKFKQVTEAFDVLSDEEMRAVYDKVRDYQDSNPGRGLPVLSPEEASLMRSGAAELSKLQRMGPKLAKHSPMEREVSVSLAKLNSGCTKTVSVQRQRVDYNGQPFTYSNNFHLVIRKGSSEGDRLVFEGEGAETVDTHPGDLIFILRTKPHPLFKKKGTKDLELFSRVPHINKGDVYALVEFETIKGQNLAVVCHPLTASLVNGGCGGTWQSVVPKQGLFDSSDPWERPPGDLYVQVRHPTVFIDDCRVETQLKLRPVHLVGSGNKVAAKLAAAHICVAASCSNSGGSLAHRLLSKDILHNDDVDGATNKSNSMMNIVFISFGNSSSSRNMPSEGTAAMMEVFKSHLLPIAQVNMATLHVSNNNKNHNNNVEELLMDDEWCQLYNADVIILDSSTADDNDNVLPSLKQYISSGIVEVVWKQFWCGAQIVSIGSICALLGSHCHSSKHNHAIFPWYAVRQGGGEEAGWSALQAALMETNNDDTTSSSTSSSSNVNQVVGIMKGSWCVVDAVTGYCEMMAAPSKEVLISTAKWWSENSVVDELEEADDDYGFFVSYCRG